MSAEVFDVGGVLRQRWDDTTRLYTEWNAQGQQTSQRAYTAEENAQADIRQQFEQQESNSSTIKQQVAAALATNNTIISGANTYLAITNPTNAQVAAQVRALTQAAEAAARQRNKIIRLLVADFTGTD